MNINVETIETIAALAAIDLSAAEAETMRRDLAAIVAYVDQLSRIPTEGVTPMSHPGGAITPLREDGVAASLPAAAALANAPATGEGMFEVPKVVERG